MADGVVEGDAVMDGVVDGLGSSGGVDALAEGEAEASLGVREGVGEAGLLDTDGLGVMPAVRVVDGVGVGVIVGVTDGVGVALGTGSKSHLFDKPL